MFNQSYPINYPNYLTYQDTSNNFIVGTIQSYPNNDVIFTDTNSILRNPFQNQPEFASPNYNRYQRLSLPSSYQHDALSNIYGFNQIGYNPNINLINDQNYNYNGFSSKKNPNNIHQPATTIAPKTKAKMNVQNINSRKDQNYNYDGYSSKNNPSFINPTTNIGKYGQKIKNYETSIKHNTSTNKNNLLNYPYAKISNNINYNFDNIDQFFINTNETGSNINYDQYLNNPNQTGSNINYDQFFNKTSETGSNISYDQYFNTSNQTVENNNEDYLKNFTNIESNTNTQYDISNLNHEYPISNYGQNNNNFSNQKNMSNNNNIQLAQNKEAVVNNDNRNNNNNINKTYNNFSNQISKVPYKLNKTEKSFKLPNNYYFYKIGLQNIGSTCYMNATLQCLLHVNTLLSYFINKYHLERATLQKLNDSVSTKGRISQAFFEIIKSIFRAEKNKLNNYYQSSTSDISNISSFDNSVSPDKFQKTVGMYNPQFKNLEANDSKDLILYLLQIMHQELNYNTKNPSSNAYPNQYDRQQTFQAFIRSYEATNNSIISNLFFGTSENLTKCEVCQKIIYNFQKFEFLTFGVFKYNGREFNLYNGFEDYCKPSKLTGDNQYYCNNCKKLCDALISTKIFFPPENLLINIDYGKNKMYMPSSIKYDHEIDITKYLSWNYGRNVKYRIICVCSHYGDSGSFGHYIAYCKDKKNSKWYQFNDSIISECDANQIRYGGTPYLLLYERID